jgi:histidinol dehydrogenase/sulfopropanediol 3-dehydrogenase
MTTHGSYLKEADHESIDVDQSVRDSVRDIVREVRERGDRAVREFTRRFDGVEREQLRVGDDEIREARESLSDGERETIDYTIANVREFHAEQREHLSGFETEFKPGVRLGQRVIPVESAGVYVPGGRHPLVASPVMTIVPAAIAGVDRIAACAPPQPDGTVQPAQLYAMDEAGADEIYCIGGAQAIAALAFGTETVPGVDKVTGPGNVYTTEAKRQVFGHVGIDFLAGPTEVLVIADGSADPALVAIDLLAQAEHDPNSRPVLVSTSESLAEDVLAQVEEQLPTLETEETARACWEAQGEVIVVPDTDAAVAVSNDYAMEHVQVMTEEPRALVDGLRNYGSLFLGEHSPVVFGDKTVGTNHTLPTQEVGRYRGGIWVGTYLKVLTHQQATADGADRVAPWAARICELEGTYAHRLSAEARIRSEADSDARADSRND